MTGRLFWRCVQKTWSEHAFTLARQKLDAAGIAYRSKSIPYIDRGGNETITGATQDAVTVYHRYKLFVHAGDVYKARRTLARPAHDE